MRNGVIVQSRNFRRYQALGSPTAAVERLSHWSSDELIYLDISPSSEYDLGRDDLNHPSFTSILEIIDLVSKKCFMPLTFGGGIRTFNDVLARLKLGADKVSVNTLAHESPDIIKECAKHFGSQCMVISIDVMRYDSGEWKVWVRGKEETDKEAVEFAMRVEDMGAGEILLNCIHKEGTGNGYDLEIIDAIANKVGIPVIALGGAGSWQHFEDVLTHTKASAVAAANIFHHSENSVYNLKKHLYDKGFPVRKPLDLSFENANL